MSKSSDISTVLGNTIQLEILKYLHMKKRGTGREIAKAIGYSPQAALNALNLLAETNLVTSEAVGRAKLYYINDAHWFIEETLIPLWDKTANWHKLLGDYYADNLPKKPVSIILFGSYARGDATAKSDLDVLLICKDADKSEKLEDQILGLNSAVFAKFGIHPSPKGISISEFQKKVRAGEGLMRNIYREGRSIYGLTPSEVIAYDSKTNKKRSS